MNQQISEIKKAILQEILWIKQRKAKLPKVESSRKELLEANKAYSHLASFGPDVSEEMLLEHGRASLEEHSEESQWLEELTQWEKHGRQQRMKKLPDLIFRTFQLAFGKQLRANARLQIARLAKGGLSIDEIEHGILHPKKIIPKRHTRLRFIKGNWVTGTTKTRRR